MFAHLVCLFLVHSIFWFLCAPPSVFAIFHQVQRPSGNILRSSVLLTSVFLSYCIECRTFQCLRAMMVFARSMHWGDFVFLAIDSVPLRAMYIGDWSKSAHHKALAHAAPVFAIELPKTSRFPGPEVADAAQDPTNAIPESTRFEGTCRLTTRSDELHEISSWLVIDSFYSVEMGSPGPS